MSPAILNRYAEALNRILEAQIKIEEPIALKLSADARRVLREFQDWLEPKLDEFGPLGYMSDWAGKLVGAVARIAGILHIAHLAAEQRPLSDTEIGTTVVEAAVELADYLIPHAQLAYMEMGVDSVTSDAKFILRWITANHVTVFQKRELHQANRHRFKRVDQLEAALSALIRRNYILEKQAESVCGPGRKPSPLYEVNPLWLSQKAQNAQNARSAKDSEVCEDFESSESEGITQELQTSDDMPTDEQVGPA